MKYIKTMKNIKNILVLLAFIYLSILSFGQAPKYDNLKILYADANYEKLVKVAASYTEKDKSAKDVLPYIWLSKGLYKISLSVNTDTKFKNAYKDAIKYLSKGIKYDLKYNDSSTILNGDHREFLDDFQLSLQETIDDEFTSNNFKRAFSWALKYKKITLYPIGANYIMGACKFLDQDKTSAKNYWKECDEMMGETTSLERFSEADRSMLKNGILSTAKSLVKSRQNTNAESLLNKAAKWFKEDEDWKELYDEILN
jgi:hypothetical protein